MGWSGIANVELLVRAAAEGFDALLTNDRGLAYEQNQITLPLTVVVLLAPTNAIEAIRPLYPALEIALSSLTPCSLVKVGP